MTGCIALCNLSLQLPEEGWVALAARVSIPLDQDRFGNASDVVPLRPGTDID